MLATVDEGTTLIYFGGNTKEILAELIETKPTYVPSVPRIFEKLYAAAMKMVASGSEEEQERFRKAVKLGVEVRMRRQRGEQVPAELAEQFDQADEQIFQRVRGLFGGQVRQAVSGAAPIAPEILEFFYAAGVPGTRGLGHDRDDRRGHRRDARPLQVRHRRAARSRASRSGSPRTARSCARARTSSASTGATPRRRRRRWPTAGCAPATSASSTTRAT